MSKFQEYAELKNFLQLLTLFGRRDHFRFYRPNNEHACSVILNLHMPVSDDVVVNFDAYINPVNVPSLVGLDVLRQLKLIVDFDDGFIISPKGEWSFKLGHKLGHLYIKLP